MSNLLDPSVASCSVAGVASAAARQLRATMATIRIVLTWFGVRVCLPDMCRANETMLYIADKKRLDLSHPVLADLWAVRDHAVRLVADATTPFPKHGVRLIRQDDLLAFEVQLTTLQVELGEAAQRFDSAGGYKGRFQCLFRLDRRILSVEPPEYLRELSPHLFRLEQARVAELFEQAAQLAESAAA